MGQRRNIEVDGSEIENALQVPGPERPVTRVRLRRTRDRPVRIGLELDIQ
jgi:hypothetical protein